MLNSNSKKVQIDGSFQMMVQPTLTYQQVRQMYQEFSNLYYTDTRVKTKLNAEGVLSGSSQVSLSGFSTTDLSEGTDNLYYTSERVKTKLDVEGVLSGSSQVSIGTSQVTEISNLTATEGATIRKY